MIDLDIIERSRSNYSIPKVPVFKKNGEVRLCLDARKLNEVIIPDCEQPLIIDTILAKFKKVKCISTLDLRSGDWQVPLAKVTQPFYIDTDAPNKAIGGELFQMINNEQLTIGFASRTLEQPETRYTTT